MIDTWNRTDTPVKRVPAPIPVAIKHAERRVGGRADAAFGIELFGKPRLCVRVRPA